MGMHEWLIQRGKRYEVTDELHQWLHVYKTVSDATVDLSLIIVQLVVLSLTGHCSYWQYWHPGWHKYEGSNRSLLSPISGVIARQ